MISSQHKFIYLHPPKTGGNSIQRVLVPLSDDSIYLEAHHDGTNRFGLRGPVTGDKHDFLQHYSDILGSELNGYEIVISVRHPFTRALSYYFSPHRWFVNTGSSGWQLTPSIWNENRFYECLDGLSAMTSYVQIGKKFRKPDHIIHLETLVDDLNLLMHSVGIDPSAQIAIPHANRTNATGEICSKLLSSLELKRVVEERYMGDMERFGYESYSSVASESY